MLKKKIAKMLHQKVTLMLFTSLPPLEPFYLVLERVDNVPNQNRREEVAKHVDYQLTN